MEPNRERVKDGFLETILKNALPGALTNLALVMLTLFFSGILPISDDQRSSIAVIVIGGTGLLVLAYTSRPLTLLRGLLLLGMGLGMGLTMLIFGGFFFLAPLSGAGAVLCGVLLALSPVLLWLFHVALNAGFALFEAWRNHRLPGKLL
jgi:cation-transporting ATPase E